MALGLAAGLAFEAAGWVRSPLLLAIALSATSLGLIVPVLKDAGQSTTVLGQPIIAVSSVADFAAVVLLTLFVSTETSGAGTKVLLFAGFILVVVFATLALTRLTRSIRLDTLLTRLQDTTAEIRVRIAVLLLVAFVALAESLGLEAILGAFIVGAIVNFVDRDATASHPHFRLKLEAIVTASCCRCSS